MISTKSRATNGAQFGVAVATVAYTLAPTAAIATPRTETVLYASGSQADNRQLLQNYGLTDIPRRSAPANQPSSPAGLGAEMAGRYELMSKLAHLASIEEGDLAPGSAPVATDVLHDLRSMTSLAVEAAVVPTAAGSVAIEWQEGDVEYTAEVRAGHRMFLCWDNVETDELLETEMAFDAEKLQRFLESGSWDS